MTYLMVCLFFYVKKDNNFFIKIKSNKLKEKYNDKIYDDRKYEIIYNINEKEKIK